MEQTKKILESIRPSVSDYASITAYHYLYSGPAGLLHLHELLNALIEDVNNMSIDELNIVSACILHKGHGKEKNQADCYRTISSCPLLSKAIDTYTVSSTMTFSMITKQAPSSKVEVATMNWQLCCSLKLFSTLFIHPRSLYLFSILTRSQPLILS